MEQTLVGHGVLAGLVQTPALLHTDAGVAEPAVQICAVQTVLLPGKVQAVGLLGAH
jgi:hypothetical protein